MAQNTIVEYVLLLKDKLSKGLIDADKQAKKLDQSMSGLQNTLGAIGLAFSAFEAVNLGKKIANLGMENEKTKITFNTLLGSTEKARETLNNLYQFASKTPFEIEEVKTASKQMLAYGFSTQELIPEMKKLGDVAAGLNIPFNEIAYLYGTLRAQGRAYSADIRQFAGRGIPIYEELAKVLKISQDKVKDYVEDGKVGFKEVSQAFSNMSGEGGKFQNLMGELSMTAAGQMSNMKDKFTIAGTALGEAFLPNIKSLIASLSKLAGWVKNNTALILKLVNTGAEILKFIAIWKGLTIAIDLSKKALINFTKISKASIITGAIAALGYIVMKFVEIRNSAIKAYEAGKLLPEYLDNRELLESVKALNKEFEKLGILKSNIEKTKLGAYITSTFDTSKESLAKLDQIVLTASREKLDALRETITQQLEILNRLRTNSEKALRQTFGNIKTESPYNSDIKVLMSLLDRIGKEQKKFKIDEKLQATANLTDENGIAEKITAAAPKVFNINIKNLVENMVFEAGEIASNMGRENIKQKMTEVFLEMLSDVQFNASFAK